MKRLSDLSYPSSCPRPRSCPRTRTYPRTYLLLGLVVLDLTMSATVPGAATLPAPAAEASPPDPSLTIHEWGTFTSFQGPDGLQRPWDAGSTEPLPAFVKSLDWPWGRTGGPPNPLAGKVGRLALQRMETPVIYAYSPSGGSLDVSVRFPTGLLTEWYPQADPVVIAALTNLTVSPDERAKSLQWSGIRIDAPDPAAGVGPGPTPGPSNPRLARLPGGNHYYEARETSANILTTQNGTTPESERFLFYRGLGNFQAPLQVIQTDHRGVDLELANRGSEPIRRLFIAEITKAQDSFVIVEDLLPGETRRIHRASHPPVAPSSTGKGLAAQLEESLIAEGLFPDEAKAMIHTWHHSWLDEPGLRVLYTLPEPWTDRILPLTVRPSPGSTVRVMVGRAELVTRATLQIAREQLELARSSPEVAARTLAGLRLGRFLGPTLGLASIDPGSTVLPRSQPDAETHRLIERLLLLTANADPARDQAAIPPSARSPGGFARQ